MESFFENMHVFAGCQPTLAVNRNSEIVSSIVGDGGVNCTRGHDSLTLILQII